ncbi:Hypothetical predicted protein [Mytilus galloprovincialis]|uniref:Uncharacterized protein n=1 Tax=Mytilus galloprovincialis TaxID=29158 RepID=A0A8B6FBQ1_MYTGA|nr:Hypothetical predicted protein [Mytilus galloprovincialis]
MALRGLKFISESQLTIGLFKSVTTVQILQTYRMATKVKKTQPKWTPPKGTEVPQLKLYNSLTRQKVGHCLTLTVPGFVKDLPIQRQKARSLFWSIYCIGAPHEPTYF